MNTPFDTTDAYLLSIRAQIAELRRVRHHLTAGIMRDALLGELERWVDPDGLTYRAELQAEQGRSARAKSTDIDPTYAPF
jgi:hypothetical protein